MQSRSSGHWELLLGWRRVGGRWIPDRPGIGLNRQVKRENINKHAQQHQDDHSPEPPVFVQFSAVLFVRMILRMVVGMFVVIAHVLFEWWVGFETWLVVTLARLFASGAMRLRVMFIDSDFLFVRRRREHLPAIRSATTAATESTAESSPAATPASMKAIEALTAH